MTGCAFLLRRRRGGEAAVPVAPGGSVRLDEATDYVLEFPAPPSPVVLMRLREGGYEPVTDATGILSFGNFVGVAWLAGVRVEVVSTKLGQDGASALLAEVSRLASELVFGWRSPTSFAGIGRSDGRPPVPYHQMQLLRHAMLGELPGERLQDHLATVERNPTQRFHGERPLTTLPRVRRVDGTALQSVFARLDRLEPVPAASPLLGSPLAAALTFGPGPARHFPSQIAVPNSRLSYDTAENRVVKHLLGECLSLARRFGSRQDVHASHRRDCAEMASILDTASTWPFLANVGPMTSFAAPTQALAKADGYKDLLGFWLALHAHVSLPATEAEAIRLLEGRDMARLYEYWVFVKVLEAAFAACGSLAPGRVPVRMGDMGATLANALTVVVTDGVSVSFNATFSRTAGSAYSTPLRPDVVVEARGMRFAFDAKYRLDRVDTNEDDADDQPGTYKRADLYKMHTYRDAILGLRAAFVVYPGTEFTFFERCGGRQSDPDGIMLIDGVGAVPLRPADPDPAAHLRRLLRLILDAGGPCRA